MKLVGQEKLDIQEKLKNQQETVKYVNRVVDYLEEHPIWIASESFPGKPAIATADDIERSKGKIMIKFEEGDINPTGERGKLVLKEMKRREDAWFAEMLHDALGVGERSK